MADRPDKADKHIAACKTVAWFDDPAKRDAMLAAAKFMREQQDSIDDLNRTVREALGHLDRRNPIMQSSGSMRAAIMRAETTLRKINQS